MPQDSPSRHQDQFLVRMPEGLRDRIAVGAKQNGRSMNAEIVTLLEAHYPPEPNAEEILDKLELVAGDVLRGRKRSRAYLLSTLEELRAKLEAERDA